MKKYVIVLMFALAFFMTACSEEEETKFSLTIKNSVTFGGDPYYINFYLTTIGSKDIFSQYIGYTPSPTTPFPLPPAFNMTVKLDAGVFDAQWVFCNSVNPVLPAPQYHINGVCQAAYILPDADGANVNDYSFEAGESYTLEFVYCDGTNDFDCFNITQN